MNRRSLNIIFAVVALAVVLGGAVAAYVWFSGGSGEASREISAPAVVLNNATNVATSVSDSVTTDEMAEASATDEQPSTTTEAVASAVVFNIVPEESQVSFEIYEELGGNPTDVIGTTDQVAGQIAVDFQNPAQSQVGTIRINMRTIQTDNEFRNRAIRGQILLTERDEYEFSDFVPTAIEGMPEEVTVGEAFNFTLTGDLSVRGIIKPVTFDVTVTPVSETRIEGTAVATVLYSDFEITIPQVPSVANVADDVELTINFVATAAEA